MNPNVRSTDPDAPEDIATFVESAEVVIFTSNLTDIRTLRQWLDNHSADYRVVTMGMGSGAERERFHCLRDWTEWHLLPQVFIAGEFVGGADEFFSSDYAQTGG